MPAVLTCSCALLRAMVRKKGPAIQATCPG